MEYTDSDSDEETDLEDMPLQLPTEDSDEDLADTSYANSNAFASSSLPRMPLRPSIPGLSLGLSRPGLSVPGIPKMSLGLGAQNDHPRMNAPIQDPMSLPFARGQQSRNQQSSDLVLSDEPLCPPESITVDLLSQAFVVSRSLLLSNHKNSQQAGKSLHNQIIERCSNSLGVAPEDLSLYQVTQFDTDGFNGNAHVCVSVNNSNFTLTAIEELLHENKRLADLQQTYVSMSERHAHDLSETRGRLQTLEARLSNKELECGQLQQEVMALRQQLRQADATQQETRHSLANLGEQFHLLKDSIYASTSSTASLDT